MSESEVVHPEDVEHPPPPIKDRAAAWVADRCATVEFAALNMALVLGWAGFGVEPFPYSFLTLVLSVEAILLTVFVLVQQRLQVIRDGREAQADLKNDAIAASTAEEILGVLHGLEGLLPKGTGENNA